MDDFPVGNPKYTRVKATYSGDPQPPQPEPTQSPDRWQTDMAAVIVGIGVIITMYLLAINWPVR